MIAGGGGERWGDGFDGSEGDECAKVLSYQGVVKEGRRMEATAMASIFSSVVMHFFNQIRRPDSFRLE